MPGASSTDARPSANSDSPRRPHPDLAGTPDLSPRAGAIGLALVLALALVLRAVFAPVGAPLDRGFDGFQAGFFGTALVNYERLGVDAMGGYPVANIDARAAAPATWYPYANHPPTLPLGLLAWFQVAGPEGWEARWQAGAPPAELTASGEPDGAFERALRLPFMAASLLTIVALYWALTGAMRRSGALTAALLFATFPLTVLQAGLVNYEPVATLAIVVTTGCGVRFLNGRLGLTWVVVAAFCGAFLTFAPLLATLPVCVALLLIARPGEVAALPRRLGRAVLVGAAALVPIIVHGVWAERVLAAHPGAASDVGSGGLSGRIEVLFQPLLDGSVPIWAWVKHQVTLFCQATSPLFLELTAFALVLAVLELLGRPTAAAQEHPSNDELEGQTPNSPRLDAPGPSGGLGGFGAGWLLFLGGLTVLFFFYKHTADGIPPGTSAQDIFLLFALPGLAAVAGFALDEIRTTLARVFKSSAPDATAVRAHAPLLVVGLIAGVLLATFTTRTAEAHATLRGPNAARPMPHVLGTELNAALPAGAIGLYPASMGLTPAVSFYGWRTLWPVTGELASVQAFEAHLTQHELRGAPLYLCLPIESDTGAAGGIAAVEALFESWRPAVAATEPTLTTHWRLWRIN